MLYALFVTGARAFSFSATDISKILKKCTQTDRRQTFLIIGVEIGSPQYVFSRGAPAGGGISFASNLAVSNFIIKYSYNFTTLLMRVFAHVKPGTR